MLNTVKIKGIAFVKEAEKPDEAYKINSATATGVKTITVELNKAVANAASLSAVVKKGASTRDSKFTVDGSKIIIAMDTKLMAGTYTVTLEGLEATALTADVVVEKDETLTSYDISEYLTMETSDATDSAICYYSALNQYGEPMVADKPDASSSFSTDTDVTRVATATVKGIISVKKIPTVLAIKGTAGTIVLVDKNNGVNQSQKVTISDAATTAEVTVAGTYNTTTSSMEAIRAGMELSNYYILLSAKDQYGDPVDKDKFAEVANISLAGGLTKVELANSTDIAASLTTVVVDGTEYIAIKLKAGKAVAGTYTMTIVNTKRGLLSSATYDVIDSVVVNSITITPKIGAYLKEKNEMEYSVIDTDGKEVTSYAVLNEVVTFGDGKMSWKKNTDGTAKLIYEPVVTVPGDSETGSTIDTVIAYGNTPSSSNYIVKTFTFTVSRERKIKSVQGLAAGTSTSVAKGERLSIALDKIIYADQYSNKVTKDDTSIFNMLVSEGAIGAKPATGCSVFFEKVDGAFETNGDSSFAKVSGSALEFKSTTAGAVNVYLKYADGKQDSSDDTVASKTNYNYKFTVTATDTGSVAATSLKIDSVNDGYAWNVSTGATKIAPKDIKVVGIIGGAQTVIPTSQYVIKDIKNDSFSTAELSANTTTKTATITIQVTTWDANNNATETELTADYQVSVDAPKVFKVTGLTSGQTLGGSNVSPAAVLNVSAASLHKFFTFKDQYGDPVKTVDVKDVAYTINVAKVPVGMTTPRVTSNGTKDVSVALPIGNGYSLEITATVNGESKTATVNFDVLGN